MKRIRMYLAACAVVALGVFNVAPALAGNGHGGNNGGNTSVNQKNTSSVAAFTWQNANAHSSGFVSLSGAANVVAVSITGSQGNSNG
jgi:hypothetical protein